MGRLRKIGLWTLFVAGLLQASAWGLALVGDVLSKPFLLPLALPLDVGLWSGLVLVPVGGLLVVIGWAFGPSAGGVKPALGGSRIVATLAGIGIGAALGGAVGVAPIMLWGLHEPALDQGALLMFFTGPEGSAVGAVVGGVLGALAGRAPRAVLAGATAGAGLGFTLGVVLIIMDEVAEIGAQIVPANVGGLWDGFLLFGAGPGGAALGGAVGALLGARLRASRKPSPAPAPAPNHGGHGVDRS
jgi:hypothetical protein